MTSAPPPPRPLPLDQDFEAVRFDPTDPYTTWIAAHDLRERFQLPTPPAVYGRDAPRSFWRWLFGDHA